MSGALFLAGTTLSAYAITTVLFGKGTPENRLIRAIRAIWLGAVLATLGLFV